MYKAECRVALHATKSALSAEQGSIHNTLGRIQVVWGSDVGAQSGTLGVMQETRSFTKCDLQSGELTNRWTVDPKVTFKVM